MAIEIVSFLMKNSGSFHSYVNVYQRVVIIKISAMKNHFDQYKVGPSG